MNVMAKILRNVEFNQNLYNCKNKDNFIFHCLLKLLKKIQTYIKKKLKVQNSDPRIKIIGSPSDIDITKLRRLRCAS